MGEMIPKCKNVSVSIVPNHCSHHAECRFKPVSSIENKVKVMVWHADLCLCNTEVSIFDEEDDVLVGEGRHCLALSVMHCEEIKCEMGSDTEMDKLKM